MSAVASVPPSLAVYRDGGRRKIDLEGRCRMCLTPRRQRGVRQLTRHHLVPRTYFGARMQALAGDAWTQMWKLRDADANIIPLCAGCHRAVELDRAARAMLRKVLGPNEAAFAVSVRGQLWFDARYPRLGIAGPRVQSMSRASQ